MIRLAWLVRCCGRNEHGSAYGYYQGCIWTGSVLENTSMEIIHRKAFSFFSFFNSQKVSFGRGYAVFICCTQSLPLSIDSSVPCSRSCSSSPHPSPPRYSRPSSPPTLLTSHNSNHFLLLTRPPPDVPPTLPSPSPSHSPSHSHRYVK